MTQPELLQLLKNRLLDVYGVRFRGLVLYGSVARGDADEESDIDLICLLDGPIDVPDEVCNIIDQTSDIRNAQGESYRTVHIFPVDISEYEKNFPLYIEARSDGVLV